MVQFLMTVAVALKLTELLPALADLTEPTANEAAMTAAATASVRVMRAPASGSARASEIDRGHDGIGVAGGGRQVLPAESDAVEAEIARGPGGGRRGREGRCAGAPGDRGRG